MERPKKMFISFINIFSDKKIINAEYQRSSTIKNMDITIEKLAFEKML